MALHTVGVLWVGRDGRIGVEFGCVSPFGVADVAIHGTCNFRVYFVRDDWGGTIIGAAFVIHFERTGVDTLLRLHGGRQTGR